MNYILKKSLFALLAVNLLAGTLFSQGTGRRFYISGTVYTEPDNKPAAYATVILTEKKIKIYTAQDGTFQITLDEPGTYTIKIASGGYEPVTTVLVLDEKKNSDNRDYILGLKKVGGAKLQITGERDLQKLSRHTIEKEEIKEVPATMGDSINALSSLAGIEQFSMLGGLGPLLIRGADPFSNRFYIDGIPVNGIQHLLGFHSVISNEMIERVDLYSSAAPATYGNSVLGGAIDIKTIDSVKKMGGNFEVSILSANGAVFAPILSDPKDKDSIRGYWFLSGRYGYLTAIMTPLLKNLTGDPPGLPLYYDYQAKGRYYFNKNHSISLLLIGYEDTVDTSPVSSDTTRAEALSNGTDPLILDMKQSLVMANHIQSISYDYSPSEIFSNSVKLYSSLNSSRAYMNNDNPTAPTWMKDLTRISHPYIFGIRDDLTFESFQKSLSTRLGVEATLYHFSASGEGVVPKVQFPGGVWTGGNISESMFDVVTIDQQSNVTTFSAWVQEKLTLNRFTLSGGIRGDLFGKSGVYAIDPRGVASYEFSSGTTVSAGAGLYTQFLQTNYYIHSQAPQIIDASGIEPEKAVHRTAGVEQKIGDIYSIKVEGFYNSFNNLFQIASGTGVSGYGLNSGQRTAYGAEITLKKDKVNKQNDFYGWLSYTYMDGKQKSGLPLTIDPYGDRWTNNENIRRHSLKIAAGYRFKKNTLGTRFRLMSSLPYTPIIADDNDPFGIGRFGPVYGERMSAFLPVYHQLDLRFSRSSTYKWGKISWYIEIQNLYNNHMPLQNWKFNKPYTENENPIIDTKQGLGILPSFGIEVAF